VKTYQIEFIDHLGQRWRATTEAKTFAGVLVELVKATPFAMKIFLMKRLKC